MNPKEQEEDRIKRILEKARIPYFICPKHGRRIGYFYSCDECNRILMEGGKDERA
jgi:hypothetical protein